MANLFLSLAAVNQEITVTAQNLNSGNHVDIFQMCPVYYPEDICQNPTMVLNADPAVVQEKVCLSININNETYLS